MPIVQTPEAAEWLPHLARWSEQDLQSSLQLPHRRRESRDRPGSGHRHIGHRRPELRMIEHVESFKAQLHLPAVTQLSESVALEDAEVEVSCPRTIHYVAPRIAVVVLNRGR